MISLIYESRFGLARGAILKGGQPHLYAEGYEVDPSLALLGTHSVARLKSKSGGMAFLALADGGEAVLDAPQEALARLTEGMAVEIAVIAEARQDKLPRGRLIAASAGEPRRLSPALTLKQRLLERVRSVFGDVPVSEAEDADMLDEAAEAALNPSGSLPGSGYLSVERTRALIACDVDTAGGEGISTPKAFARTCNEQAVGDIARRLRLSGLAGLVVMDLIGKRHDAERLRKLLLAGFGAEAETIIPGIVGKFGTLEFVRPWGDCPLIDAPAPLRDAYRLLREAAKRAEGEPGRLVTLRAPAATLDIIRPLLKASHDPLSAILRVEAATRSEVTVS